VAYRSAGWAYCVGGGSGRGGGNGAVSSCILAPQCSQTAASALTKSLQARHRTKISRSIRVDCNEGGVVGAAGAEGLDGVRRVSCRKAEDAEATGDGGGVADGDDSAGKGSVGAENSSMPEGDGNLLRHATQNLQVGSTNSRQLGQRGARLALEVEGVSSGSPQERQNLRVSAKSRLHR
jgi:hypothetical protein